MGGEEVGGEPGVDFGGGGCGDVEVCGLFLRIVLRGDTDGRCSYEHHNIEEPAILLGGAFVVDVVEKEEKEKEQIKES